MHDSESSQHELNDFEARLAALAPSGRVDRDRLMFAAGRRAGARRLRVANRLLATASVALAAVAVVAVAQPRLPRHSVADNGEVPAVGAGLGEGVENEATDSGRTSVALIDGPTHFRLRRSFAGDVDQWVPKRPEPGPPVTHDAGRTPPSHPRELLKQYLNTNPDRL